MTEFEAISDFLKEHGREEWGEKVARLTGKVYVLTDGTEVLGVFSSNQAARDHPLGDATEEFTIDDLLEWEVGPVYTAAIRIESGEICNIRQLQGQVNRHSTRCHIVDQTTGSDQGRIVIYSPISTAHAMQAAMDRRDEIRRARTVPDRTDGDPWTTNANANPLEDIRRFRGLRERGDEHSALT